MRIYYDRFFQTLKVLKTFKVYVIICIFVSLLLFNVNLTHSDSEVQLETKIDKQKVTIGDLIHYTIIILRNEDVKVEFPGAADSLGAFEIRDYQYFKPQKIQKDGKTFIEEKIEYVLSTFIVGEYFIPSVSIKYTNKKGESNFLKTDRIDIKVESLKPSKDGDIRDVKKPLLVERDYKLFIIIGACLLVIIIIVVLYIVYIKKRKKPLPLFEKKIDTRPPHIIALEAIENLKKKDYLQNQQIKEYFIEFSEIIRRYVEMRYEVPALEEITTEIVNKLHNKIDDENILNSFGDMLQSSDMIKFAKVIPTTEEIESITNAGIEFIDKTKSVIRDV